jgi:alpha-N-arabinofuranosidase
VWHPEAVVDNGLEQPQTLRDAVFAGACLNLFNRYAHRITMANIAQTVNVLQCMAVTDGARMALTPTYHVFDMMRPHMGAQLLTCEVDGPEFEAHPVGLGKKQSISALSVSVSVSGKRVFLSVANQTLEQDIEARIVLREARVDACAGKLLHSASPRDTNSFENPKNVAPKRFKLEPARGEFVHVFPAHSFTALSFALT